VDAEDLQGLPGPGPNAGNEGRGWSAGLAKLSAPRLHGPIPRERLYAQLDRLRQHSCVWLSAPPGAGKTTLMASYAQALGVPAFWYQCDRGDADAATLFHYLGVGYQGHCPDKPALPALAPEHLSQLDQFSRRFFQQLFAALPSGALLVLDNWQEAECDVTCSVLAEVIRQVPPRLSLIVISRHDPPASIGALATTQLLASMPREALLFDEQETRALAGVHGVTDNRSVKSLSERCQGWAAGLTLMLDSVGRTGRAISPAPGRLFDFFATQVLQGIPNAGQRTLMIVALPMRVSAVLASELSQDPGAPDLLETLYRRQLFTYRSGDSIRGYHFHALFRDFLLARARRELGDAGYRDAAARTAMILATAGLRAGLRRGRLRAGCNRASTTRACMDAARALAASGGVGRPDCAARPYCARLAALLERRGACRYLHQRCHPGAYRGMSGARMRRRPGRRRPRERGAVGLSDAGVGAQSGNG
jgi:LuxR family transcriptional regulator, maltose regulon positive regulatory protein